MHVCLFSCANAHLVSLNVQGCPPGKERRPILTGPCVKCRPGYFKSDPGMMPCKPCDDPSMPFSSDDRTHCKFSATDVGFTGVHFSPFLAHLSRQAHKVSL